MKLLKYRIPDFAGMTWLGEIVRQTPYREAAAICRLPTLNSMKKIGFLILMLSVQVLWAGPLFAKVYSTKDEALKRAFPGAAAIERENLFLSVEDVKRIEPLSKAKMESRLFTYYRVMEEGKVTGYAHIGSHVVRTKPEVYMVVIHPDGSIRYVEILAFYEPEEYLPAKRWFEQFAGRNLDDTLWPRRGVHAVTGATMSVNGIVQEVRKVLAVFKLMIIKGDGR